MSERNGGAAASVPSSNIPEGIHQSASRFAAKQGELEARWLPREEMQELMSKIREKVAAGEAERIRNTPVRPLLRTGNVYPVEEEERRDELREQAAKLLAQEGEKE